MITDEQLAEIQHDLDTRQQMNLTEAAQILAGHTRTLLGAVEQLRYERRLLGACRRHLDEIADPEGRYTVEAVKTAGDLAQRIVDEIGHPVTDEPALGPEFREQIAKLERELEWAVAERDHALGQVKKPDYEKLVDAYLSGAKPVAEQLMQANEALARHGHDPIECGCELSTNDSPKPGGNAPVESAPAGCAAVAPIRDVPCQFPDGHPPLVAHEETWDHGNASRDAWWTGSGPRAGITDQLVLSDADFEAALEAGEINEPAPAAAEHPVRCPEVAPSLMTDGQDCGHLHRCIHPAKVPDDVVGFVEHVCECGTTWTLLQPLDASAEDVDHG